MMTLYWINTIFTTNKNNEFSKISNLYSYFVFIHLFRIHIIYALLKYVDIQLIMEIYIPLWGKGSVCLQKGNTASLLTAVTHKRSISVGHICTMIWWKTEHPFILHFPFILLVCIQGSSLLPFHSHVIVSIRDFCPWGDSSSRFSTSHSDTLCIVQFYLNVDSNTPHTLPKYN